MTTCPEGRVYTSGPPGPDIAEVVRSGFELVASAQGPVGPLHVAHPMA